MTIQIGRLPGKEGCDSCPVSVKDAMTEIRFSQLLTVRLCPACLVLLEKLIKVERSRVTDVRAGRS